MSSEIAKATAAATDAHAGIGDEYLTFSLGDEEYAVDILKVQEIRGYENVTRLPDSPAFIKGVINLRGVIVPIVDLRLKFELGQAKYDELTVMIILNLGSRVVGIVVAVLVALQQLVLFWATLLQLLDIESVNQLVHVKVIMQTVRLHQLEIQKHNSLFV